MSLDQGPPRPSQTFFPLTSTISTYPTYSFGSMTCLTNSSATSTCPTNYFATSTCPANSFFQQILLPRKFFCNFNLPNKFFCPTNSSSQKILLTNKFRNPNTREREREAQKLRSISSPSFLSFSSFYLEKIKLA